MDLIGLALDLARRIPRVVPEPRVVTIRVEDQRALPELPLEAVGIELGRRRIEQGFVVIEARLADMPGGDHEEGYRGGNDDGSSKGGGEACRHPDHL